MYDVCDIVVNSDDPIDPNLQRGLDLVQHLLIQGASVDVSFTPYLSKSQKKKITKAYQTRSQGHPSCTSKMKIFFYFFLFSGP